MLTQKMLENILRYLEKSLENLANDAINSLEYQNKSQSLENFLSNQFDVRLQNLLEAKKSSIHHLESGMKNKIIQRKQKILGEISRQVSKKNI